MMIYLPITKQILMGIQVIVIDKIKKNFTILNPLKTDGGIMTCYKENDDLLVLCTNYCN